MDQEKFALPKKNIYYILIGLAFMVVGYLLMSGGGTDDPSVFPEKALFSFRRITLAPIFVLVGMAIEVVAIMYRPKK